MGEDLITIHCGLHKTGSTAIQDVMNSLSASELGKFRYLGVGNLRSSIGFAETPRSDKQRLNELTDQGYNLIFSSEDYLGSLQNYYRHAPTRAVEMKKFFESVDDFRIVIYLRPQPSWLHSAYIQHIKFGGAQDSDVFLNEAVSSKYFQYSNLIQDLIKEVETQQVVIRPYVEGSSVVEDFFDFLGLEIPKRVIGRRLSNVSFSTEAASIMRKLNPDLNYNDILKTRLLFDQISEVNPTTPLSLFSVSAQGLLARLASIDFLRLAQQFASHDVATSQKFQAISEEMQTFQPVPDLETAIGKIALLEFSQRALLEVVPRWQKEKPTLKQRLTHFVKRVRSRVIENPRDVPRITYSYILRRVSRSHKW